MSRGPRQTGAAGKEPARELTPYECSAELTPLETAVVKILPKWPEALKAVFEYAALLSGVSLPTLPGESGGGGGGPDGLWNPV